MGRRERALHTHSPTCGEKEESGVLVSLIDCDRGRGRGELFHLLDQLDVLGQEHRRQKDHTLSILTLHKLQYHIVNIFSVKSDITKLK